MKRFWRGAAIVPILAGSLLSIANPAWASCNPGRTDDGIYYYDGDEWAPSGPGLNGVQSNIWNYNPYTAVGANALDFVMLQLSNNWAQIGRRTEHSSGEFTFYQWTTSPGNWLNINVAAQPVSTFTNYKVDLGSGGNFNFYVDGTKIDGKTASFTPIQFVVEGEIHSLATQMPGAAQNTESNWAQKYRENDANDTWYDVTSYNTINSRPTSFANVPLGSSNFDIYDKACTGS
jgi:hypothetical protein